MPSTTADVPLRTRLATATGLGVATLSRLTRRGEGSTVGGRVALTLDAQAIERQARTRAVALVSGTNGKTTTTALLAAAVATAGQVASNIEGANMAAGVVLALARAPRAPYAVLEVDERHLPAVAAQTRPRVVTLLNLSRDQLDRHAEVRALAGAWRTMVAGLDRAAGVVANADDPLVTYAAQAASRAVWVGAGQAWREDAAACPACSAPITFGTGDWECSGCELRRPPAAWQVEGDEIVDAAGDRYAAQLALPGRHNTGNAALALATTSQLGLPLEAALAAMRGVRAVAGRYAVVRYGEGRARLVLAKNPAGWLEALALTRDVPVVLAVNAQIADGRDPSWLWDVPYEQLQGRRVLLTGERAADLAVRLHYADVTYERAETVPAAVRRAGPGLVDVLANYTAFQAARRAATGG